MSFKGLGGEKATKYVGALHIYLRYRASKSNGYPQLIPPNTVIKIGIEPMNLSIELAVK